jgi:hypothetical protein
LRVLPPTRGRAWSISAGGGCSCLARVLVEVLSLEVLSLEVLSVLSHM